jgi:NTP pyrophosphatase (non-canonical NTP hydrolase)
VKEMKNIIERALAHYGKENQLLQFYEELNELGAAVNHYKRGKITKEDLVHEIGDVHVMLEYVKLIFDITDIEVDKAVIRSKVRLENKLLREEK